jgi:hypothetical protein
VYGLLRNREFLRKYRFGGKPEGKRSHHKWEDNIKMGLKQTG